MPAKKVKSVKTKVTKKITQPAEPVKTIQKISQIFTGRVVSVKTLHTATVLVEGRKTHPLYAKTYKRSQKYLVHDENGVLEGDLVEITKCKPISKKKHFRIVRVIGKDMEAIITQQLKEEAQAAIEEVMPEEKVEEQKDQNDGISEDQKTSKELEKKQLGIANLEQPASKEKKGKAKLAK
jgi:small subunit ribosomal protein S17